MKQVDESWIWDPCSVALRGGLRKGAMPGLWSFVWEKADATHFTFSLYTAAVLVLEP